MTKLLLPEQLSESFGNFSNKPCLHIKRDGQWFTMSYGEVKSAIAAVASSLLDAGLPRGSAVAIIGDNSPEWVIVYLAVMFSGGRVVPMDQNLSADEIADLVARVKPFAVFCEESFSDVMLTEGEKHGVKRFVCFDKEKPGFETFSGFSAQGNSGFDFFADAPKADDVVSMLFTSGTTGKPKGAMLTMRNYSAIGPFARTTASLLPTDTMLAVLPLYHVFGFAASIIVALVAGCDIVIVPQVKGPLILEAMRERGVSLLCAVPRLLVHMKSGIDQKAAKAGLVGKNLFASLGLLSDIFGPLFGRKFRAKLFTPVHKNFGGRVRLIVSGGAALDMATFLAFRRMGFDIIEGYGMTETFGPITFCPPKDARQGTVGPAIDFNEVRIDSPDADGCGDVLLRGDCVFAGYYNEPQASAEIIDREGWLHSGDIGRLDKRGFLYLTGRRKSIIVLSSGKNVFPEELEEYFSQSPLIEEMGVFGFHGQRGDVIAAMVVPSQEIRLNHDAESAKRIIRAEIVRMSGDRPIHKRIQELEVCFASLPRTSTKKIKIKELPPLFDAVRSGLVIGKPELTPGDLRLMQSADFVLLSQIIATNSCAKNSRLRPDAFLEKDLCIDSLSLQAIMLDIERKFSLKFPDGSSLSIETVGDLYAAIQKAKSDSSMQLTTSVEFTLPVPASETGLFRFVALLSRLAVRGLIGATVNGVEKIPQSGGVIFVANHQSMIDVFLFWQALPDPVRVNTCVIGRTSILGNTILRRAAKRVNFIQADGNGDTLRAANKILSEGKNLLIFPEGAPSRTDELGQFRSGIGRLMHNSGATMVPVRVRGTAGIWPRGGAPRPANLFHNFVSLSFGAAISFSELVGAGHLSSYASDAEIAAVVREKVLAL